MKNWPLYRWGWDKGKLHCDKRQPTFPPILTQGQFSMMCFTKTNKPNWGIHQSDTSLKPLTDELNNIDHLLTMQCSARKRGSWHSCGFHLTQTTHSNTITIYYTPPPITVVVPQQDNAPCHTIKTAQKQSAAQLPILLSKSDLVWPYLAACRTQRICRQCSGSETTGQRQSLTQGGVPMDWTSYGC